MPETTPEIRQWELMQRGVPYLLTAEKIGHASSRRSDHNHPDNRPYEPKPHPRDTEANRTPCAACYWTENTIFRTHGEGHRARYAVYVVGGTSVPNKHNFTRLVWTDAHHEVIEILVERRPGQAPVMNATTARALSQAASKDADLDYAWINRALP